MGVYIKGMEMPNNCMACPLFSGNGCRATKTLFAAITNVASRVDSCPLTEVHEPHGRLIDADALADDLEADGKEFGEEMKLNCASWIRSNATPTVIERSNNE